MRRFALAVIVGLLTFSASGVYSLVIAEPCTGYEQPGQEDELADEPPAPDEGQSPVDEPEPDIAADPLL